MNQLLPHHIIIIIIIIITTNSIKVHFYILIYIQQDAMLHSLFYLETALRVSGGTSTHHQERKQLYLQHLVFVTQLPLPAAIVEELEPWPDYLLKLKG
jgi:hypothetical protein